MSRNSKRRRDEKNKRANRAADARLKRKKEILASRAAIEQAWPDIQKMIGEHREAQSEHERRFGAVRQQIDGELKGTTFVAVGPNLYADRDVNTFPDFLLKYLATKLSADWCNGELQKEPGERHVIVDMYIKHNSWLQGQTADADGIIKAQATGVGMAILQLAYDFYVLEHNAGLQAEIIKRLKAPDGYQGARYELMVAATLVRGDFEIDYADETDKSRKHPEFVATHRQSGEQIAVEAKSRHRPGVLGYPGKEESADEMRAGINRVLNNALGKAASAPYVIFVDLNLPPVEGDVFDSALFREIKRTLERKQAKYEAEGGFPATMVFLTNHPHHYSEAGDRDPTRMWISAPVTNPKHAFVHGEIRFVIERALSQYGNVPNQFDHD